MIRSFRHKGLRRLFESGNASGVKVAHVRKLQLILARLNVALNPQDMALPGLRLHPLKGKLAGYWSVSVSGNWRVTFAFRGLDVVDLDYLDYH